MQYRIIGLGSVLRQLLCILLIPWLSLGLELPSESLRALQDEDFKVRETAQADILEWASKNQEPTMDELFRQSQEAENPEVRARCLAILRNLVEVAYLSDGEGYIGIVMGDECLSVPGDPTLRMGIRVLGATAGSGAEKAGLDVGDLIVGLNDAVWYWYEGRASLPFRDEIRKLKPKSRISLKVLRDGLVSELEVELGRRPDYLDDLRLNRQLLDLEAADKTERDAYFQQWMEQRKAHK